MVGATSTFSQSVFIFKCLSIYDIDLFPVDVAKEVASEHSSAFDTNTTQKRPAIHPQVFRLPVPGVASSLRKVTVDISFDYSICFSPTHSSASIERVKLSASMILGGIIMGTEESEGARRS